MGPQFIRFDKYGEVGAHEKNSRKRKRSMHDIAAEQVREPHACPHVTAPKPHIQRFGCDPREAVAYAKSIAKQALDVRGRRLRNDAPVVLGGVISWREPLAVCLEDPEAMERWASFRDDSIAWIHQYWGDHLRSVVEHVDEAKPHVQQFIVVTHLDPDRRIRLTSIHPGLHAEKAAAQRGVSKREQKEAHQAMTKDVVAVTPHTTIEEAAKIMLRMHISGLPVIDDAGNLVGVVSESDFLRRNEIGTGRKHAAWLKFFMGPARAATEFVHERGRKVKDVMTQKVISVQEETSLADLVDLMEKHDIKRVPVMRGQSPVGIVTRTNLLQAMASLAHEIPDPTADDEHIRERITRAVNAADWRPIGFEVNVRRGVVHLHGIITTDEARRATIVAAENTSGVKEVYDHLRYTYSEFLAESGKGMKAAG
ncbi:CBS domain-containing protein [Bradyrhizobium barranii subsp. barranii]|uniref:CBS domain-containing protein n=2 Tax=Bradyrhizobium barranii subsp. barranii TaxID=2823807 RepID=A0A9X9Z4F7_9BRAD|nr:CBS domain-containing protein [Bradyrhizobium barranii]UGX98062.1 CBS domain-containing protein [Bradyrhizobium barranii subsp. barranii]